jgi:hypothetical protein
LREAGAITVVEEEEMKELEREQAREQFGETENLE